MSSKGTIFLTNSNEHVYEETNDWSIVFEINKESISLIELYEYNIEGKLCTTILDVNFDYLIIQTKSYYNFSDSFKLRTRDWENILKWDDNTPDCLYFKSHEIANIETDISAIKKPQEMKIFIKKESEWYQEYVNALRQKLESDICKTTEKLNKISLFSEV
jgi:hypothetical protein